MAAVYQGAKRSFVTFGNHSDLSRMGEAERVTKRRLDNPDLWRQLSSCANGIYVNHLGPSRPRWSPVKDEQDWQIRLLKRA